MSTSQPVVVGVKGPSAPDWNAASLVPTTKHVFRRKVRRKKTTLGPGFWASSAASSAVHRDSSSNNVLGSNPSTAWHSGWTPPPVTLTVGFEFGCFANGIVRSLFHVLTHCVQLLQDRSKDHGGACLAVGHSTLTRILARGRVGSFRVVWEGKLCGRNCPTGLFKIPFREKSTFVKEVQLVFGMGTSVQCQERRKLKAAVSRIRVVAVVDEDEESGEAEDPAPGPDPDPQSRKKALRRKKQVALDRAKRRRKIQPHLDPHDELRDRDGDSFSAMLSGHKPEDEGKISLLKAKPHSGDRASSIFRSILLSKNIATVCDARIRISHRETMIVEFRCLRSLIAAGMESVPPEMADRSTTFECHVAVDSPQFRLTESEFLGVILGIDSVSELCRKPMVLGDLCEIIEKIGMKRLLSYVCDVVSEEVDDVDVLFEIFRSAFDRYEQPVEDPSSVMFRSVLTVASYAGLQRRQKELRRPSHCDKLKWLLGHCLWLAGTDLRVSHPAFAGLVGAPLVLVRESIAGLKGSGIACNFEVKSQLDGGVVRTHIEALVLAFDFMGDILQQLGEGPRVIELEKLSTASIELLCSMAQLAEIESTRLGLAPFLELVRYGDEISDISLLETTCGFLESVDTRSPSFRGQLEDCGALLLGLRSTPRILMAWASQGAFSVRDLRETIWTDSTAPALLAPVLVLENRLLRNEVSQLRSEVERLNSVVEQLKKSVEGVMTRLPPSSLDDTDTVY